MKTLRKKGINHFIRFSLILALLLVSDSSLFAQCAYNLSHVSSFGWLAEEQADAIRSDKTENVYVAGSFHSSTAGSNNLFILKFDPAGNILDTFTILTNTTLGSILVSSMVLDQYTGAVYVSGKARNVQSVDFDPGPNITIINGYGEYILKLDSNLNFIRADFFVENPQPVNESRIAVDDSGNIYFASSYYFMKAGQYTHNAGNSADMLILKMDPHGDIYWIRKYSTIGWSGQIIPYGIEINSDNEVFVVGFCDGEIDFDPDTSSALHNVDSSAFVLKLSDDGSYGQIWLGPHDTKASSVNLDRFSNIYVTGTFSGTDTFESSGANILTSIDGEDEFIAKLNSQCEMQWVGSINASIGGIDVDNWGYIFLTGYFEETVDFDPGPNVYTVNSPGWKRSTYILQLHDGVFVNFTKFDGHNWGSSIAASGGNLYTCGSYSSIDFDPGPGTISLPPPTGLPGYDLFLSSMSYSVLLDSVKVEACNRYVSPSTSYIWTKSGFYSDVISAGGNCDTVVVTELTVMKVDGNAYQFGDELVATASNASYQWLDCNNNFEEIQGETDSIFHPQTPGKYAVEILQNGCIDTIGCFTVLSTGISEKPGLEVSVYPNPSNSVFTISFEGGNQIDIESMRLYNSFGEEIQFKIRNLRKNHIQIAIVGHTGLYEARFNCDGVYHTIRLLKLGR